MTDPLLYDALIRRFQTPAEREAEGKAKGYGRVLEGSLLRGEERLAKLAAETGRTRGAGGLETDSRPNSTGPQEATLDAPGTSGASTVPSGNSGGDTKPRAPLFGELPPAPAQPKGLEASLRNASRTPLFGEMPSSQRTVPEGSSQRGGSSRSCTAAPEGKAALSNFDIDTQISTNAREVKTKAEGLIQWESFLRERFVRGEDEDFDYDKLVDNDDDLDVLERRDREEAWFDDEEAGWVSSDDEDDNSSGKSSDDNDMDVDGDDIGQEKGGGKADAATQQTGREDEKPPLRGNPDVTHRGQRKSRERILQGETGIQDF